MAPQSEAATGFVGVNVMLAHFADRPARVLDDDEILVTGKHRFRYLATPHVPHCWDAGLLFDEEERTFFCSDLFFQPGDPDPLTESDIVGPAQDSMVKSLSGPLANDLPYTPYTDAILQRLADLDARTLAVMHGSSFRATAGPPFRNWLW